MYNVRCLWTEFTAVYFCVVCYQSQDKIIIEHVYVSKQQFLTV